MGSIKMTVTTAKRPTFGAELRRLRLERGWTQAELARRAGLTRQTINYLEQDRVSPRFNTLEKLLTALGITGADLLADDSLQSEPFQRMRTLLETVSAGLVAVSRRLREQLPQVSALIRKTRERAGISQKELAKRCGLTQTAIASFERAHYSGWSLTAVVKVAEELRIAEQVESILLNRGGEV